MADARDHQRDFPWDARRLTLAVDPTDLPPWGTVYRWFAELRDTRRFETINHYLVMKDRERVGREASPSAAIIDSQSVKTTESGGPRGYDAGKKIKGRKRHALVDTDGRGLMLEPHEAGIQDRDGAVPLLKQSRSSFPFVEKLFADSGYAGDTVATGFQQDDQLIKIARPLMVDLTKIVGWPISLTVRMGGKMMVKDSTHPLTTQTFVDNYPGYTLPLQDCAFGKAYFAFCSDDEREIIQENSTYENEEESKLGYAKMLLAQKYVLEGIRADGYATHTRNLHCDTPGKTSSIAVPIVTGDRLMGCLTVIFFTAAMPMEYAASQYAGQFSRTASDISESYLAAKNSQNEYISAG